MKINAFNIFTTKHENVGCVWGFGVYTKGLKVGAKFLNTFLFDKVNTNWYCIMLVSGWAEANYGSSIKSLGLLF